MEIYVSLRGGRRVNLTPLNVWYYILISNPTHFLLAYKLFQFFFVPLNIEILKVFECICKFLTCGVIPVAFSSIRKELRVYILRIIKKKKKLKCHESSLTFSASVVGKIVILILVLAYSIHKAKIYL